MLNKVIAEIEKQQAGKENTAVYMVGEQLKDICKNTPGAAEIVLQDLGVAEMSIEKAERKIKEYADKQKRTGNCVCVPPDVAEKIIREFYGISGLSNSQAVVNLPENDSPKKLNLEDFL